MAENGWNSQNPAKIALAYTEGEYVPVRAVSGTMLTQCHVDTKQAAALHRWLCFTFLNMGWLCRFGVAQPHGAHQRKASYHQFPHEVAFCRLVR